MLFLRNLNFRLEIFPSCPIMILIIYLTRFIYFYIKIFTSKYGSQSFTTKFGRKLSISTFFSSLEFKSIKEASEININELNSKRLFNSFPNVTKFTPSVSKYAFNHWQTSESIPYSKQSSVASLSNSALCKKYRLL